MAWLKKEGGGGKVRSIGDVRVMILVDEYEMDHDDDDYNDDDNDVYTVRRSRYLHFLPWMNIY